MTVSVQVKNIKKSYSTPHGSLQVLKGVTLSVAQGGITGVIGRSGAGKSTLLRCLNGLEIPSEGHILIEGEDLLELTASDRRQTLQKVGTVFQSYNLLSRRTVSENIAFPLEVQGVDRQTRLARAHELANVVGLEDKLESYPSQLSGGQCQRVAIARALSSNPTLLLCDEFTSALDPETSIEILSLLRRVNKELGVTVFLITHDMSVVREVCDQVCVMDQGEVVESGPVEGILLAPQHKVTQKLLRSLFVKDLPQKIQQGLKNKPTKDCQVVLRLVFSGDAAQSPLISTVIDKYKIPVNIIAGSLDHIREMAFGCLTITLPYDTKTCPEITKFLQKHHVNAEQMGFIAND